MIKLVKKVKKLFTRKKEEGAALVEYGLLVALIALGCIIALGTLGNDLSNMFKGVGNTISKVPTTSR
jgi:pilus assembly protein Flp/PilA